MRFLVFLDLLCHHAFRICGKDDRCPVRFPYAFSTFFKHSLSDSFGFSKRPCVSQVYVTQERSGWHDDMEKEENASSEKASDSLPQVCKHGDMTFENKIPEGKKIQEIFISFLSGTSTMDFWPTTIARTRCPSGLSLAQELVLVAAYRTVMHSSKRPTLFFFRSLPSFLNLTMCGNGTIPT